jgi:hypothetical protein
MSSEPGGAGDRAAKPKHSGLRVKEQMIAEAGCKPDLDAIRSDLEFMTRRWGELGTPCMFEVRSFADNTPPQWSQFTPSRMDEAVQWVAEQNIAGRNVYVVRNPIALSHRGPATDASIVAATFCWADCDDPAATDNVRRFDGPKWTFAVTTGRTPDTRVHVYWELAEPVYNLDAWRAMQVSIAAHFQSDPVVINPSRIMRVGGTVSHPPARKQAKGYTAEVCTIRTEYEDGREPVEFERLLRVFKPAAPQAPAGGGIDIDTGPQPLDRERARVQALSGAEWHNAVIRLVASYVSRGLSDDEIHSLTEPLTLAGYTAEQTRREVQTAIDGARSKGFAPDAKSGPEAAARAEEHAAAIEASAITEADLATISPRLWLYGRKLVRGFVSVLASPGGTGKSAWVAAAACDMAAGVNTIHDMPHRELRVWLYNLEDPRDETLRKLAAILLAKRYVRPVIPNIFVNSGRDHRLILAEEIRPNVIVARPDVDAVIAEIKAKQIDVLTVDPFVRSHMLPENDNKAMDFVMDLYAQIASEANCAVLLVHHTRKGFVSGDSDSVRGGSATTSAARVAMTMQTMTTEEAKCMSVPEAERRALVRIDGAKSNLAPPASDAEWFRLTSQSLGNGTDEYPHGDSVQVVFPWSPPDAWDGLGEAKANEILDRIAYGFTTESGATEKYSSRSQDDRWAGNAIMASFPGGEKSHDHCRRIIKTWIDSGVLAEVEYQSPTQRKTRRGLDVLTRPGVEP